MNARLRELHDKIWSGENFTIFSVEIRRTLARELLVEALLVRLDDAELLQCRVRHTNAIVTARSKIARRIDLRAIETFSSAWTLATVAGPRGRRHTFINALSTLVARKVVAWTQMASSANHTWRTQAEESFGGAHTLATLARLICAEILMNLTELTDPISRTFAELFAIGRLNARSTIHAIRAYAAAIGFRFTKLTSESIRTLTDDR